MNAYAASKSACRLIDTSQYTVASWPTFVVSHPIKNLLSSKRRSNVSEPLAGIRCRALAEGRFFRRLGCDRLSHDCWLSRRRPSSRSTSSVAPSAAATSLDSATVTSRRRSAPRPITPGAATPGSVVTTADCPAVDFPFATVPATGWEPRGVCCRPGQVRLRFHPAMGWEPRGVCCPLSASTARVTKVASHQPAAAWLTEASSARFSRRRDREPLPAYHRCIVGHAG